MAVWTHCLVMVALAAHHTVVADSPVVTVEAVGHPEVQGKTVEPVG